MDAMPGLASSHAATSLKYPAADRSVFGSTGVLLILVDGPCPQIGDACVDELMREPLPRIPVTAAAEYPVSISVLVVRDHDLHVREVFVECADMLHDHLGIFVEMIVVFMAAIVT